MNKYCDANYVNLQAKNCAENKYCYIIIRFIISFFNKRKNIKKISTFISGKKNRK